MSELMNGEEWLDATYGTNPNRDKEWTHKSYIGAIEILLKSIRNIEQKQLSKREQLNKEINNLKQIING